MDICAYAWSILMDAADHAVISTGLCSTSQAYNFLNSNNSDSSAKIIPLGILQGVTILQWSKPMEDHFLKLEKCLYGVRQALLGIDGVIRLI